MRGELLGMETELAFSAWQEDEKATPVDRDALLREFFSLAQSRLPSLPDQQSGIGLFLANGSRLYLDCGSHPELCTPECVDPLDVVRWQLAGEQLLVGLVDELEKKHPGVRIGLFRCNVDYSGTGSTWGCHESYQHCCSPEALAAHLIPHLVTRIVYTGAGGFDNRHALREFLLSPRVPHLTLDIGGDHAGQRSIFHTRDEPLSAGGFRRLHVICGESLCSQLASYLKLGTTALMVRLVEAGVSRAASLALASPVAAMEAIARDPACRVPVELADGRWLSALEIQRSCLTLVEEQVGADFLPPWAPALCRRWRLVLEQLAVDPALLATSLDWGIKRELIAARDTAQRCELDTRFGELGQRSVFAALDRAGALDHRLAELGSVEEAMTEPPPGGRAAARGRAIRRLSADRDRYACTWESISDLRAGRFLDLRDPFVRSPRWQKEPGRSRVSRIERLRLHARHATDAVWGHYQALDLDAAIRAFARALRETRRAHDLGQEATARFWAASAHQDAGNLDAAEAVLEPMLARSSMLEDPVTRIRVLTRWALIRLERPAPLAEIERVIADAEAFSAALGGLGRSRISSLRGRLAGALCDWTGAADWTERALHESPSDLATFSTSTYRRLLITFALRAGDLERARRHVEEWRVEIQRAGPRCPEASMLAALESQLALCEGRGADAFAHALAALDGWSRPKHRHRLLALLALVESATFAGELDRAEACIDELSSWRTVGVGELRLAVYRAEAQYRAARLAELNGVRSPAARAARLDWARALRGARAAARAIDQRLGTHHARMLETLRWPT